MNQKDFNLTAKKISAHQWPQSEVLAALEQLRKELPKSSYRQIKADIEEGRQ